MKKFARAALAVVLVLTMTVSAFAAVNSPSQDQIVIEVDEATVTDAEGNSVSVDTIDIIITEAVEESDDSSEEATQIQEELAIAKQELEDNKEQLQELIGSEPEDLPADTTLEDYGVIKCVDVSVSEKIKQVTENGGSVNVIFTVPGVEIGDIVLVAHKGKDGWEWLKAKVVGPEKVEVVFTNFSPVAFLTLKGVEIDESVTSPATGMDVADVAYGVVAACVAAL